MAKFPLVLLTALALSCQGVCAFACGNGDASVKDLKTGIEDGENSSDSLVYMTGYVENRCTGIISVTVTISAEKDDGTIIGSHSFDIDNIPAGGQGFDLAGAIPYDAGVEVYDVTGIKVRDTSQIVPHGRQPRYQPPAYTGSLTPGD